jgi:predicted anti-sigma-YlaC factor YlaD
MRVFYPQSIVACLLVAAFTGCSIERVAMNRLADSLANTGTVFAADNDPELVRDAAPFSLKLMETVLESTPDHDGLLLALASGFTQYGYAFVQQDAERVELQDFEGAEAMKARAAKLYRRARDYGLRALDARHAGWSQQVRQSPVAAAKRCEKADVPALYWTSAAWGALISLSKDKPEVVADLPQVAALTDRALALDADYGQGALHSFMITFTLARADLSSDPKAIAKKHFDRAVELSGGQNASPFIDWVEAVSVQEQNADEFSRLLNQALAIDLNARPEWTLANTVLQRRARWLLKRKDDLILPPLPPLE